MTTLSHPTTWWTRARLVTLARHPAVEAVIVLAAFGALSVAMTWPLAAEFSTRITGGGGGGDAAGYVWDFWRSSQEGLTLWGRTVSELVGAPIGREFPGAVNATLLVNTGPGWLVSEIANPIAAFNVVALSGLALSGAAMYLLVRWLGLGIGPAAWAGLAFTLAPYLVNRVAAAHPVLLHLECFPLLIMAGLYWSEKPGMRRAALMALAWLFCCLSNPYFGVAGGLIFGSFVVWVAGGSLMARAVRPALVRAAGAAAAGVAIVILPIMALFLSSRGEVESLFTRQKFELLLYGARLDDYVRPLPGSIAWDAVGNPFAYAAGGERVAYLGAATIVLAIVAIVVAIAGRTALRPRQRTAALIPLLALPVLVVCSLASPQQFLGLELHFPTELLFELVPFMRAFARLSSAAIAVLIPAAAVGLWVLVRGRPPILRSAIVLAAMAVVVLEQPGALPVPTAQPVIINGASPADVPTWRWLRERNTDEIVYEMPGRPNEPLERIFMLGQTVHGHRTTNGSLVVGSLSHDFQRLAGDVTQPNRAAWLASLGIDLVTVSPWAYLAAAQPPLDPATPPRGFETEARLEDGSAIWRVAATPADGVPVFRARGWWEPDLLPDGRLWRWMDDEGHVTVLTRTAGLHRVTFRLANWPGPSRVLELSAPGGQAPRIVAGAAERIVSVDLRLPAGASEVVVRNLGRPAEQISAADVRIVSVRMSEWQIRRLA